MKTIDIKGIARTDFGKKGAKKLRNEDLVPCNLYGVEKNEKGLPTATPFSVKYEDLRNLVYSPNIYSVNLTIDNKECKAIMKEIQFHPVTDKILHIDFLQITDDKPIEMEVPIELKGLAVGVKAGGKLQLQIRKLKVKATYDKIPEKIFVKVDNLALGKSIKVAELSFEGLDLVTPKEVVVCSVKLTRTAVATDDTAAAATTAAPAAAPAANA